ncbi:MAG: DUF896 domain-containing protein [Bacillota bacterium]
MIPQEIIDRVNYYARKARAEGLTEAEKLEQKKAREEYLALIRAQVKSVLDNMKPPEQHPDGCQCGAHDHHHHHGKHKH